MQLKYLIPVIILGLSSNNCRDNKYPYSYAIKEQAKTYEAKVLDLEKKIEVLENDANPHVVQYEGEEYEVRGIKSWEYTGNYCTGTKKTTRCEIMDFTGFKGRFKKNKTDKTYYFSIKMNPTYLWVDVMEEDVLNCRPTHSCQLPYFNGIDGDMFGLFHRDGKLDMYEFNQDGKKVNSGEDQSAHNLFLKVLYFAGISLVPESK